MNNSRKGYYRTLFLTAAFYDFSLGIIFLFFYKPLFHALKIPIPSDPSYLSLSAAFVFVLGVAYYLIYRNIEANRDLAKIGTIYKAAYVLIGLYYFLFSSVPHMIFILFAVIDFIFLILFVDFLMRTKKK